MKLMGSRFTNIVYRKKHRHSRRVRESIVFICPCGATDIRRRGYDEREKVGMMCVVCENFIYKQMFL